MTEHTTIPVIRAGKVEAEAYNMGASRFQGADLPEDGDPGFEYFQESAEYANTVLPSLRALCGHGDPGHGTYTDDRPVAVVDPADEGDVPIDADKVMASGLLPAAVDSYFQGAYEAMEVAQTTE